MSTWNSEAGAKLAKARGWAQWEETVRVHGACGIASDMTKPITMEYINGAWWACCDITLRRQLYVLADAVADEMNNRAARQLGERNNLRVEWNGVAHVVVDTRSRRVLDGPHPTHTAASMAMTRLALASAEGGPRK